MSFYVNSGLELCQWAGVAGFSPAFYLAGLNRAVSRENSQFSSYRRALTLAISLSVIEDCVGWGDPEFNGIVLIQ